MIAYAQAQLGKPYVWGGSGPDTFDCAGLTVRAYQQIDIALPTTAPGKPTTAYPTGERHQSSRAISSSTATPCLSMTSDTLASPSAVSVPEAARIVGIGRSTLYEHVRAGLVPSVRIGRRVVIPTEVIEALFRSALTSLR